MFSVSLRLLLVGVVSLLSLVSELEAQETPARDLDRLLEEARRSNPRIHAAELEIVAARSRTVAAGALPDPQLVFGLMNGPLEDPFSSRVQMTMRSVQVRSRFPFPGKLGANKGVAAAQLARAAAELRQVISDVTAELRSAYYDLVFVDRSMEIVARNRELLKQFEIVTRTRYTVGTGAQQDVLKAQVEHTRLGDQLVSLAERRASIVARINGLLDRPEFTEIGVVRMPASILRVAVPAPGERVQFTFEALRSTGRVVGVLRDRGDLLESAEAHSPILQIARARIDIADAEHDVLALAALPDFDLQLGYGQRSNREDLVTLMVSIPLPIYKGRKQDRLVEGASAEVERASAELSAARADLRAEISALHEALIRARDQIALSREGILPQARASLDAAVAGYPVASVDFLTLLDNQVTLFRHELDYYRLVTEFAQDLAELERIVGTEVTS